MSLRLVCALVVGLGWLPVARAQENLVGDFVGTYQFETGGPYHGQAHVVYTADHRLKVTLHSSKRGIVTPVFHGDIDLDAEPGKVHMNRAYLWTGWPPPGNSFAIDIFRVINKAGSRRYDAPGRTTVQFFDPNAEFGVYFFILDFVKEGDGRNMEIFAEVQARVQGRVAGKRYLRIRIHLPG